MLQAIGPLTWAVIICVALSGVAAILIGTHKVPTIAIGIFLGAGSLGAAASIIAFEGAQVPGTKLPIGLAAGLVVAALLGVSVLGNMRQISKARKEDDKPKAFDMGRLGIVVVGGTVLAVAVTVILGQLDINAGRASAGLDAAMNETENIIRILLGNTERFLKQ